VPQASLLAEEVLKTNPDAIRVIYNKFKSAISYKPTIATVLSAEVRLLQPHDAAAPAL
jgi:F-type H+-transporting ATPase subunit gamma